MSIDWITVAAQIANFLVLVWLLKRFLYRPILDGIDAREAEITARMQEAAAARSSAAAVEAGFHAKERALHIAQSEMTETVRKQAEDQRDALLAEAEKRMQRDHASWRAQLDDEARDYTTRLHRAGADALLSLVRKAVADLADETLEQRIAHHLVRQITPKATDLSHAAGQGTDAVITSHAPLLPETQASVRAELKTVFPDVAVTFRDDPQQAPGLVLRMGGAQLAWTVDTYVDGLDDLISERLAAAPRSKGDVHAR